MSLVARDTTCSNYTLLKAVAIRRRVGISHVRALRLVVLQFYTSTPNRRHDTRQVQVLLHASMMLTISFFEKVTIRARQWSQKFRTNDFRVYVLRCSVTTHPLKTLIYFLVFHASRAILPGNVGSLRNRAVFNLHNPTHDGGVTD